MNERKCVTFHFLFPFSFFEFYVLKLKWFEECFTIFFLLFSPNRYYTSEFCAIIIITFYSNPEKKTYHHDQLWFHIVNSSSSEKESFFSSFFQVLLNFSSFFVERTSNKKKSKREKTFTPLFPLSIYIFFVMGYHDYMRFFTFNDTPHHKIVDGYIQVGTYLLFSLCH